MKKYFFIALLLISLPILAYTLEEHQTVTGQLGEMSTEEFIRLSKDKQISILEDLIARYKAEGVEVKLTASEYRDLIEVVLAHNPDYIGIMLYEIFEEIIAEEDASVKGT